MKKIVKKVSRIVGLDFQNCTSLFPSHRGFMWPLRYPKNNQKWPKMVKNDIFHDTQFVTQMIIFKIVFFLDAYHHLSLFWTKLSEIGGTPTIWSPKYSQKWWKMAENLHDRKDTKIERKSNKKVIRVIELDLLNCPSKFPSFTRFIWPLRCPKNGEKWSKMAKNNVFSPTPLGCPSHIFRIGFLDAIIIYHHFGQNWLR